MSLELPIGRAALAAVVAAVAVVVLGSPSPARAFCGFYVAGADAELVNEATMVVMMREGSRTVLSMQNHYQGPPESFAMVIPVPEVLEEDHVKVLGDAVFERVDHLAAPRLVEYWEKDPCEPPPPPSNRWGIEGPPDAEDDPPPRDLGVTVEAEFAVGEYEIVILGAEDSAGLDTWLRENGYTLPEGAEPVLRPYVEADMKFFVAKVDVSKVRFVDGQAVLSPLRFHYDSESFSLPVRLGLLNAEGEQDLIVHILAPRQRYEVANYANVTIPTNVDVVDGVRGRFAEFYAALFDETLARSGPAVVTEYAWQATGCDPCPGPVLDPSDLMTLGADVLPSIERVRARPNERRMQVALASFVLTRLHTRYDRETLTEDLVFREAPSIVGGRERLGADAALEHGASPASFDNFQARYAIRHHWGGPIDCEEPIRGRWGGPPEGLEAPPVRPATDTAFVARDAVDLSQVVRSAIPELALDGAPPPDPRRAPPPTEPSAGGGCGSCAAAGSPTPGALLLFLLVGLLRRRR